MKIKKFADMHVHFRHDNPPMMERVVRHTALTCAYAVVMPNTRIATVTPQQINEGRHRIKVMCGDLKPLMTFKMEATCTPEIVQAAHSAGAVAAKLYPEGITTEATGGMTQEILENPPKNIKDSWAEMENLGMLKLLHGEMPKSFVLDAEKHFTHFVEWLALKYPKLKIVMEHITTRDSVDLINRGHLSNVAATITYHHLSITLDNVLKHKLVSRNYCKPVAKYPYDREALLSAAFSGNPKFFLGSDTAPHLLHDKHCGCAGCYTAPVLAGGMVELFDDSNRLGKMEGFATNFGPAFYNLEPITDTMELNKEDWIVPDMIEGIEPFRAGETIKWKLA